MSPIKTSMISSRLPRQSVACRASSSKPNPSNSFVRSVFDKRSKAVKDNLSRLYMIGAADYKELTQIVEDLDKLHKKAFQDMKKKMDSEEMSSAPSAAADDTTTSTESSIFTGDN
jgi:hypothetical protein